MKAARIHSFGPPDVVVVEDVPVPSPGPGEVIRDNAAMKKLATQFNSVRPA